ncbi:putative receptor-like protein kinase [Citrus sinensis]|uniref:non-specific serine/threonine protein kinase n=1 Tax=Citrus sinensis TaxID=2711 RepID=A0A067FBU1_CITSI|nr:putative receptor-like protein kinase [Citrus sinensis]KDO64869.1 hypothetical protein CISIN_1g001908mg [Citrus sinensis]GAY41428.1 hypothetical protein CUMW_059370 [Citrus unshiu]
MLNSISITCLATFIFSFSLLLHSQSFSAHTNETDRLALLAIKSQLHDPLGVTNSWNNSINLCQWAGVTCGHRHQRVTELDLRHQNIGGSLSPYVGNLSFLRYINLATNNFHGEIPKEIGFLFRLETLMLANNSFSGKIPTNLSSCSNLLSFVAYRNNLVGEIPEDIGYSWLKLEHISLARNHLTGMLPASIGNLSIIYLHVGENQFSGTVPPSLYNMSSLENILLDVNGFTGNLPLDIGVTLPNLQVFAIGDNYFSGSIPESFSNASNIEIIDLPINYFTGKVSIIFGRLKNLWSLDLGINNLGSGGANDLDFVTILTNCSKLKVLAFEENRLGGVLPHSIANLSTTMTDIYMGVNQISGTIPSGIGNLVNLNLLGIEFNQLTGNIPREIGQLRNLQAIGLSSNFLQGNIPSSLGNLTLMTDLFLSSNHLQGNIPPSLGNCKNLVSLNLSDNKLIGAVPQQILTITTLSRFLDLGNNHLNGSLPLEVGNLKNLVALYISGNQFSGEIPVTLTGCTGLEIFHMQGNSFRGSIPLSLRSLKSIKELDLSCNNLSGQIPEFLENLSFLEYLNLSYNHFDGEVPTKGVFSNKTRVQLTGNGKLCGGSNELHLPSCPSKRSRKSTVLRLGKVGIPMIVSCLILSTCFIIVYARRRRSKQESSISVPMEQYFPMVSYSELSEATNEFSSSNMIGQGSFGSVYKGILGENGTFVAVKILNLMQKGALKSFVAECEVLRNTRHRNLIKIITVCSSIDFKGADFKALVYEYMQNGSLEEWLHQSNGQPEVCDLSLIQRLNIAIDMASAIEYLHHHCQPPIVHGDLKPSNVLLDHDMVAHVSDFGLARFLFARPFDTSMETQSSSIGIKGTVGYVPPGNIAKMLNLPCLEYGMGSEASVTGDVYSLGVMLLEMFTRRRPTNCMFQGGLTLHEFCKMALPEKVMETVDPSLLLAWSDGRRRAKVEECLVTVIRIGVACSMESPIERMEMRDVLAKLCAARQTLVGRLV